MQINRNMADLATVSNVTIPRIMADPTASLAQSTEEETSKQMVSTVVWSLAGVAITIIACCCAFGIVFWKRIAADSKAEPEESVDEEAASEDVASQSTDINDTFAVQNETASSALIAETGMPVPLTASGKSHSSDDKIPCELHGVTARHDDNGSNTALVISSPKGHALSAKNEIIDLVIPPGKLGLTLVAADALWPLIQIIDDGSAVSGLVEVGDLLVSYEGKDVRVINQEDMTEIMNEPCEHNRRITLLRRGRSSIREATIRPKKS